jgi:glycosyltransferase involved in cell wall biosynthesis
MATPEYVLVTPARNEGQFIGQTIEAVISQTIQPKKWIIISDGSTDLTDAIVTSFAAQHKFICFLRMPRNGERSFGAKVRAFRASHEELKNIDCDYVGNLDADVTFAPNYYERILQHFASDSHLGIAGGIIHELIKDRFVPQRTRLNSVAGAVQLFRRRCYEDIGGYIPLRFGGVDSAAEIMARMSGWSVRTYPDLQVLHHRPVGSGAGGIVRSRFRQGRSYYSLGYHPVFELLRSLYRSGDRPYVVGSILMACGYWWSVATRQQKEVPEEVVRYLRSEQLRALRSMSSKRCVE